jgi:predicted house-cleaning NTP pyrophosphatase (Maf/HAM1 superfamily)
MSNWKTYINNKYSFSFRYPADAEVFEKPTDKADAKRMLQRFSDRRAEVFTGVCYIDSGIQTNFSACVTNAIKFRPISEREIEDYVVTAAVTSWSGGFSPAYPYGLTLFEEITGSPSAFSHGFPMGLIIPLLEKSGVQVRPK